MVSISKLASTKKSTQRKTKQAKFVTISGLGEVELKMLYQTEKNNSC